MEGQEQTRRAEGTRGRWCPLKNEISAVRTGNLEVTPVSVYQAQGC